MNINLCMKKLTKMDNPRYERRVIIKRLKTSKQFSFKII